MPKKNGTRGAHFAKSLNSDFLKGLTYSAVSEIVFVVLLLHESVIMGCKIGVIYVGV